MTNNGEKGKCLRKPKNMPNQDEVGRVQAHIDKEIARLTDSYAFWSSSDYLLLRDLLITQITIFNGHENRISKLQRRPFSPGDIFGACSESL